MKLALAVGLLLGMASMVSAYEVEGNPDRRISFGVHFDHGWNYSEYGYGSFKIPDFSKARTNAFQLDTRIPLNSIFTFSIRGGFANTSSESYLNENVDTSDKSFGFSFRAYLP